MKPRKSKRRDERFDAVTAERLARVLTGFLLDEGICNMGVRSITVTDLAGNVAEIVPGAPDTVDAADMEPGERRWYWNPVSGEEE
jgi:hypothetical protein